MNIFIKTIYLIMNQNVAQYVKCLNKLKLNKL